jgi:hypothetical protein
VGSMLSQQSRIYLQLTDFVLPSFDGYSNFFAFSVDLVD